MATDITIKNVVEQIKVTTTRPTISDDVLKKFNVILVIQEKEKDK